jgi:antitoxin VapB
MRESRANYTAWRVVHVSAPLDALRLTFFSKSIYSAYIFLEEPMARAKVFRSGNSQAVRIPKEFQFNTDEVEIEQRGDEVVLRPPVRNLRGAYDALAAMPDDFYADGRKDSPPQSRKGL